MASAVDVQAVAGAVVGAVVVAAACVVRVCVLWSCSGTVVYVAVACVAVLAGGATVVIGAGAVLGAVDVEYGGV